MTESSNGTRTIVVERALAHPPEEVWRALTQPQIIEKWLMDNDFKPVPGHRFTFKADWGTVECEVREVDPERALSYTWEALGLVSVVNWTLTSADDGTRLRMEQSGFRADQDQAYRGAEMGWASFLDKLENVLNHAD